MKKIAIIGAGWQGIGITRILSQNKDFIIKVYEKNDDIGGVWHPKNHYPNLSIHEPSKAIEFFDFPLPDNIDRAERVTAAQVYNYLKNYCHEKKLFNYFNFNVCVQEVNYDSKIKKSLVILQNRTTGNKTSEEFDFIINTNGFANTELPDFPGKEEFSGEIIHSLSVTEDKLNEWIEGNKKIVVLGASKTATDFIMTFLSRAYKVLWLYRKPYWFFNYDTMRKAVRGRVFGRKKYFFRNAVLLGLILKNHQKIVYWIWRSLGIIHTFGERHTDFRRFHIALIDKGQMKNLKSYNKLYGVEDEILKLEKNFLITKKGQHHTVDVIICCTGSGVNPKNILKVNVDGKNFPLSEVDTVYRARVVPKIPNLIFTAYHRFTGGVANSLNNGRWVEKYIESKLTSSYLIKSSIKYDIPFFVNPPIFSRHGYFLQYSGQVVDAFVKSGELPRTKYLHYVIDQQLCGDKGVPPFELLNKPSDTN